MPVGHTTYRPSGDIRERDRDYTPGGSRATNDTQEERKRARRDHLRRQKERDCARRAYDDYHVCARRVRPTNRFAIGQRDRLEYFQSVFY